jgi:hypothetical protein
MPIQVNSYFAMGKTHTICQDYAATHNADGNVVLAVSDGCSSSPDTDFGSRFLVKTGIIERCVGFVNPDSFGNILRASKNAQENMGLPYHSLDATLILSHVFKNKVHTSMWGDGAIVVKYKDGTSSIIEVDFIDNTPAYLSYLGSPKTQGNYFENHGSRRVKVYTSNGVTIHKIPVMPDQYNLSWEFPLDEVRQIFFLTDGVGSFRSMSSMGAWEAVPLEEVVEHIVDVKNFNGEFMVRRMRKFLYDFCPKNNWIHEDDIAVAALINLE